MVKPTGVYALLFNLLEEKEVSDWESVFRAVVVDGGENATGIGFQHISVLFPSLVGRTVTIRSGRIRKIKVEISEGFMEAGGVTADERMIGREEITCPVEGFTIPKFW